MKTLLILITTSFLAFYANPAFSLIKLKYGESKKELKLKKLNKYSSGQTVVINIGDKSIHYLTMIFAVAGDSVEIKYNQVLINGKFLGVKFLSPTDHYLTKYPKAVEHIAGKDLKFNANIHRHDKSKKFFFSHVPEGYVLTTDNAKGWIKGTQFSWVLIPVENVVGEVLNFKKSQ